MKTLFKSDFIFLKKTNKLIIFPVLVILFSILSPITAKYIGEILEALVGTGDLIITIPPPELTTSYAQYLSDLNEIILYVIMFLSLGMFIRDKTKGIMPLVLSKPINRDQYLISKYLVFNAMVFISLLIGYFIFSYYTYYLFDDVMWLEGLAMMGIYYVYILFITSIALWASTTQKSYIMGIVITFAGYILFAILGILKEAPVFEFLPGVLITNATLVIIQSATVSDVLWNVVVTLLVTIVFIILSIVRFRRQDI